MWDWSDIAVLIPVRECISSVSVWDVQEIIFLARKIFPGLLASQARINCQNICWADPELRRIWACIKRILPQVHESMLSYEYKYFNTDQ